jgi:hypothetical protein
VNNIEMGLRNIGYESIEWIDLSQDKKQRKALVDTVINSWVP